MQNLGAAYREGASLEEAIGWAKAACTAVIEDNGAAGWEAAVVERTDRRRAFRRLDPAAL